MLTVFEERLIDVCKNLLRVLDSVEGMDFYIDSDTDEVVEQAESLLLEIDAELEKVTMGG